MFCVQNYFLFWKHTDCGEVGWSVKFDWEHCGPEGPTWNGGCLDDHDCCVGDDCADTFNANFNIASSAIELRNCSGEAVATVRISI